MPYAVTVTSAESLGRMLQQDRLPTGLSQRELAERLNTTQRHIWEIESGKPSIYTERLFAMMRETGLQYPRAHPGLVADITGFTRRLAAGQPAGAI